MKAIFVCLCIALFLLQAQGRPRAQLHSSAVKTDRPIIGKETLQMSEDLIWFASTDLELMKTPVIWLVFLKYRCENPQGFQSGFYNYYNPRLCWKENGKKRLPIMV